MRTFHASLEDLQLANELISENGITGALKVLAQAVEGRRAEVTQALAHMPEKAVSINEGLTLTAAKIRRTAIELDNGNIF
jgi:hypothetical protein